MTGSAGAGSGAWTYQGLTSRFAAELAAVERGIAANLGSDNELLSTMAAHAATSGGKRLRPLLAILCARLQGYAGEGVVPLGNAVEYLHGIAISEAAIHFRLIGPTLTVGDPVGKRGYQALRIAVDLLSSGACRTMLAGWLDVGTSLLKQTAVADDGVRGAIFIVLSSGHEGKTIQVIREKGFELFTESGTIISAISDLIM